MSNSSELVLTHCLSTSLVFDLLPLLSLDFLPAGAHREAHLVSPEAQLLNLGFVIAGQVRNANIVPSHNILISLKYYYHRMPYTPFSHTDLVHVEVALESIGAAESSFTSAAMKMGRTNLAPLSYLLSLLAA